MFGVVIGVAVLLLLAILFMLFRVYTLLNVGRGAEKKDSRSNKINAVLMLVFLIFFGGLFFWYSFETFDEYDIPVAAEHGILVDQMFWQTMWITGIVFILTNVLLFVFAYKYRYKDRKPAFFYPDNSKLEIAWTVIPAIVLTILVFNGLKTWNQITDDAPEDAEVVEVMGYQFAWGVRYPGKDNELGNYDFKLIDASNQFGMDLSDRSSFDDFVANEIHIPVGVPVLFKIRARDVLHSAYAPHFRLKMDAVPGMPTRFWFVPTKTTAQMRQETGNPEFNYELACAEVCGRGHFSMRMVIVVDEVEDYEKWKSEQATWLSRNPDYISRIPDDLKELALISAEAEPPAGTNNNKTKAEASL